MMYQWGRKDPFTPATTTPSTTTASANVPGGKDTQLYSATGTPINTKSSNGIGGEWTHSTAVASNITALTNTPSTFYTGGNVPIASTGNLSNDWWNPTTKTLYDPCPAGYRIPSSGTYNSFTVPPNWSININNGMTWNTSFFSASGYRHSSNGKFYSVGYDGYVWMSTPYSATFGHTLFFRPGRGDLNTTYQRSYSWPTRCISE